MLEFVVCHRGENEFTPKALVEDHTCDPAVKGASPTLLGLTAPSVKPSPRLLNGVTNSCLIWVAF